MPRFSATMRALLSAQLEEGWIWLSDFVPPWPDFPTNRYIARYITPNPALLWPAPTAFVRVLQTSPTLKSYAVHEERFAAWLAEHIVFRGRVAKGQQAFRWKRSLGPARWADPSPLDAEP